MSNGDMKRLLKAAEFAEMVYTKKTYRVGSNNVLIEKYRNTIYIAISGTDDVIDWLRNFRFMIPKKIPGVGWVHRGFDNAAEDIYRKIWRPLTWYKSPNVVFCGHSAGGAIASRLQDIIISRLDYYKSQSVCISFGKPKDVFESAKPLGYNIRVEHIDDPVPKIPCCTFMGSRYGQKADNVITLDDKGGISVADHKIDKYRKLVEDKYGEKH